MSKKSKKRKLEGEEQSILDWEQESFFTDELRVEMESMWEIPQTFHFLHLTKDLLNIPHLSMYEMERMLLMPRASKQLANIMTSLLSSPITKAKLRKIPPMPYEFWTNILTHKMNGWFKVYHGKHQDAVKVLETIGVEPEFWNVFPDPSKINGKDFEDLTFRQRVWLLKTVCDTVMHTRKTVQEELAKQPWEDQFDTVLGIDKFGARYLYFPQFTSTDLRIYRHCIDNTILSTVKPRTTPMTECKIKTEADGRASKGRKRKLRWRNGLPAKARRRMSKRAEKDTKDYKCSGDSGMDSLTNEESVNSAGTYSNNNHINLNGIAGKRTRTLSKASDESAISSESRFSNTRSSGYNSTTSSDSKSLENGNTRNTFKGFSGVNNESCNMAVISGILNGLKEEIDNDNETNCTDTVLMNSVSENSCAQKKNVGDAVSRLHSNGADSNQERDEPTEKQQIADNLSSSSKTDDEKLNEIIGADRLNDEVGAVNFCDIDEVQQMSSVSKSDDEKLNATKSNNSTENLLNNECGSMCNLQDSVLKTGEGKEALERTRNRRSKTKSKHKLVNDIRTESGTVNSDATRPNHVKGNHILYSDDDKDSSLNELRNRLQQEAMISGTDSCSDGANSEIVYNLRRLKDAKTEKWEEEVENFHELLVDLSVSNFQLVADSVEALKDLIASFSSDCKKDVDNCDDAENTVPSCEESLIKRLTELLISLEPIEPALKEAMRKARSKLQREWTNFQEGSVEDQDSSGEGGLSSNWWVLGSQGCPLPSSGDATLQTLSQSAISSLGAESQVERVNEKSETNEREQERAENRECDGDQNESEKSATEESERRRQGEEDGQRREGDEAEDTESKEEDREQQPGRVLRARGVSSYTEQLYSDEEIDENELEEWSDVEAVYAAPCPPTGSPIANSPTKVGHGDDWSEKEDSDQDWILPGSRKRKNKRSTAHRRLKSFQHKLQSIKSDSLQNTSPTNSVEPPSLVAAPTGNAAKQHKGRETKESHSKKSDVPQPTSVRTVSSSETVPTENPKRTVPSVDTICKIEAVGSVHSELDIKEEIPFYDTLTSQYDPSCNPSAPQNYLMVKTDHNPMNYYVMHPNPTLTGISQQGPIVQQGTIVSGMMPPIQHGYYLQGPENYIIHNPQSTFLPPQQPVFHQPGPQMMSPPQQFVNHPAYLPYMVRTAPPPPPQQYIQIPRQQIVPQELQVSPPQPHMTRTPNRFRSPNSQQPSFPHPNGAVIRSSMPIRSSGPRTSGPRAPRASSQPRQTNPKQTKPKKLVTSSTTDAGMVKTTSLIVLSDSDDDIEMIITEKSSSANNAAEKTNAAPRKSDNSQRQKPTITSEITVSTAKGTISPQIIQRMSQGGISITPVKPVIQPVQNPSTQLVVVVNETGSHYALSLPNGSKLILTPEQVAQIRASNGGKLVL